MSYELKIKLSDIHYTYSGYPHDDEEFEVSVWDGDTMIPIGDIAKIAHESAGNEETAIAAKYGSDFAKTFIDALSVFDEEWWDAIDEDMNKYCRVSACDHDYTEYLLRELQRMGIEVEDVRSEELKKIAQSEI